MQAENIKKFLEREGLPKWMTSLCGSVIECLDSNENSKGDVLARQAWGLIRESQQTYSSRYGSFIGGRKNGPRASPRSGLGQPKNKKSGIPLAKIVAEGGKTFYEDTAGGRLKFVKVDDVVYYVTKGDSLCYDIAAPPPPCQLQSVWESTLDLGLPRLVIFRGGGPTAPQIGRGQWKGRRAMQAPGSDNPTRKTG